MLNIGIQSKLILGEQPKIEEFNKIKKARFDCIDFNLDRFLPNSDIYQGKMNDFFSKSEEELSLFFESYYKIAVEAELFFSQVHAPYPLYVYGRESDKDYLHMVAEKSIKICAALRSPYLIIHPFKLAYHLGAEEEYQQNRSFFESLIPTAQKYDVIICLENLYDGVGGRLCEGVCADPHLAVNYIDSLNQAAGEERFGFCFDVGHANLFGRNMKEFINILGKRLKTLHLHDNDGIHDLHQMPFTFAKELAGETTTDWKGLIEGLRENKYSGVLSFETFGVLKCFPEELHEIVLKLIAEIGQYFAININS